MNEEFIYFDKTHPMLKTIRSYIVSQCQTICRNEIHEDTVKREFLDFDFGYVHKVTRAKRPIVNFKKNQKETVHSFILCKYDYNKNKSITAINIQLLCNSVNNSYNNKDGIKLIELVEQKAIEKNIYKITLFSLGKTQLKKWYEKLGFVSKGQVDLPGTKKIKVYIMSKELD